jgi:asparagine synthetase B (glutamine-hydrolysing)
MSEIGAIFHLRGGMADPVAVQRMAAARAMRSCAPPVVYTDGPIALVDKPFWHTPEGFGVGGPAWSSDGAVAVLAEMRIDNRDDLLAALPEATVDSSDAELAAHVYRRWGEAGFARLHGDYSIIVWDAQRRRLSICRDILGMRPLYYAEQNGVLYVSGSFRMLFDALPIRPALNESMIVRQLARKFDTNISETVVCGIRRLEPGYVLVAAGESVGRAQRFDRFGVFPLPNARRDEEWIDLFTHTLAEAVRVRLRRPTGTAASFAVSGGLDSSALACVAHERLSASTVHGTFMHTMHFNETPSADEREYFDSVAEKCSRFGIVRIPSDGAWAYREYGDDDGYALGEPEGWPLRMQGLMMFGGRLMTDLGVVLWGMAGDLMTGAYVYGEPTLRLSPSWPAHIRRRLNLVRLKLKTLRRPFHYVDSRMQAMVEDRARRLSARPEPAASDSNELLVPEMRSPLGRYFAKAMLEPMNVLLRDMQSTYARHMSVDHRTPYQDRRFVELMMRFPPHLLHDGADSRVPLRRLNGILPEKVRIRRSKSFFNALNDLGWIKERERILDLLANMRLAALGFVDGALLRDGAQRCFSESARITKDRRVVNQAMALESWLRVYGY